MLECFLSKYFYEMHNISPENKIFFLSLAGLLLVVFGFVPRPAIFLLAGAIAGWMWANPWQKTALFFVRFIPFFFALPLTENFDNFNFWRIAILIIFTKMLWEERKYILPICTITFRYSNVLENIGIGQGGRRHTNILKYIGMFLENWEFEIAGISIFILAFLSLFFASYPLLGLKRWIYFVNIALLYVVCRHLLMRYPRLFHALAKNFLIGGLAALGIGLLQWVSTYFAPIWIFHYWWGQVVSLNMYGAQWADIVTNFGNTWFSYSGGGLRLRMFGLFPDSHTFPLYLLMVLPALFLFRKHIVRLFFYSNVLENIGIEKNNKNTSSRLGTAAWWGVFLTLHLALILSGTRGIWATIVAPAGLVAAGWFVLPRLRTIWKKLALSLFAFALMFPVAWGILFMPQFQDDGVSGRSDYFFARLRSLLDLEETSNKGRLYIWQKSVESIAERPLLGVGLGNFPVVLDEATWAARAGSSAHNLYLTIAAEIGLPALFLFLILCLFVFLRGLHTARDETMPFDRRLYAAAGLFSFIWILAYSMTDAALFDERALLGFMVLLATMQVSERPLREYEAA